MRRRSILTERFRTLRDVQADRPVVVSCYLDTSGRDRPRHPELLYAAEQVARSVRADADRLDLDREERWTVEADLNDFLRMVVELVDRGTTRGLITLGLVLTDRERTRIALQELGELEQLAEVLDEVPAQTSGGGWAQARLASPGANCPGCGQLALALECPSCGAVTDALDDVVSPTLEEAMRQGATVVVVPDSALETVGGVGAVLRY